MKIIFGPVPSRRLGFSLGVDIIPFKTCTFDCVYCELGKTDKKTVEPVAELQPREILQELDQTLSGPPPALDFITITGSGEPSLHPQLGLIIEEIKKRTSVPVALLTNGSLLFKDEVLERVLKADLVLPSLDASDEAGFQTINRPHPSLSFENLINGLTRLGNSPGPQIWLEVLLLKGMNDDPAQMERIGHYINKINPEKVQLNTVVRPPVEGYACPLPDRQLQAIQKILGPRAEIIAGPARDKSQPAGKMMESKILELVARRPCTAQDIAQTLGLSEEKTASLLRGLIRGEKIKVEVFDRQDFYRSL
ncbi:MAG: radical SAM protein [Thermodesulfobacteriota bacterium]